MPVSIPPFTDVPAPNDPVASPWAQHLTQFAVDMISSGPTAPTNPEAELWYDTSDSGISLPNGPRGFVAYGAGSAAQSGIGATTTDLTGATATWNADPSRKYLAILYVPCIQQATATGTTGLIISNGVNQNYQQSYVTLAVGAYGGATVVAYINGGLSGNATLKGRINTAPGTVATLNFLPTIIVLDIGGN